MGSTLIKKNPHHSGFYEIHFAINNGSGISKLAYSIAPETEEQVSVEKKGEKKSVAEMWYFWVPLVLTIFAAIAIAAVVIIKKNKKQEKPKTYWIKDRKSETETPQDSTVSVEVNA